MICLKGEKRLFDECMSHLKKLYSDGKLKDWRIISAKVPLFVTHTPCRNVYKFIADMERDLDRITNKLSDLKDKTKLETKIEPVETNVKNDLSDVKDKIDAVKQGVKMTINALNACHPSRPQQSAD